MEYLTESGMWLSEDQVRQRRISDDNALTLVAGRDEDGEWSLLEAEKTKKKAGKRLSPSSFAFVGDRGDPSTWKLPVHDAAHARNALARFNQTQGIPAGKKAAVLAKIKRAARKFGVKVSEAEETETYNAIFEGSVSSHFTKSDGGGMDCKICGAHVPHPKAAAAHLASKHPSKLEGQDADVLAVLAA